MVTFEREIALKAAGKIALAALIVLPFLFPFAEGPSVNVQQQLATWCCVALLSGLAPTRLPSRPLIAWLATTALAVVLGHGHDIPLAAATAFALAMVGIAAGVGAGMACPGSPAPWAWALFAAGLLSAALGLLQYYGLADALVPWTTAPEPGQAYGNLRQRNQFASLVSMALIAALWLHAVHGRRVRAALAPGALLLVVAAAAATSRTGLLQLLLIAGISAFLAWRERRRGSARPPRLPHPLVLVALVLAYFIASWLLPQLAGAGVEGMLERLRDGAPDAHSRLVLWRNVIDLIARHPWAGWGWGELKFAPTARSTPARASSRSWTTPTTCRCTWRSSSAFRPPCWSAAASAGWRWPPGRGARPTRRG